jgi:hypothetical protein
MAEPNGSERHTLRLVLAAIAAIGVVLLLAYARGEPGFDDRTPDSDEIVEVPPAEGA